MPIKIDAGYMKESLRAFVEEEMVEGGFDKPDIFILITAQGNDLVFSSSSNVNKKTTDTLKRAVYLQEGDTAKLKESEK